jgi:glycine/D-amino acid oxidase-like deaminating enzyme
VPDVVVVGGGIIGAACAYELARRGASVTLLEKDELAAGASGRNLGFVDEPRDPVLVPMARASLERYLEVASDPPVPFHIDPEPIGTLTVALDEAGVDAIRTEAQQASANGVRVEGFDGEAARELEPELSPEVVEAWLLHEGRRVDPGGLTVCLAHLARGHGATIHHHLPARRLRSDGDRITGVLTDDGAIAADLVVLAVGPWTSALLRPLGVALPVAGARGWLVHLAPARPLVARWIEGAARMLFRGRLEAVTGRELASDRVPSDVGPMIQPAPDGTILAGTSREPALTPEPLDLEVPRRLMRESIRIIPSLGQAPVLGTWSGVRPMSPDERPLVGPVREGLLVASGHGSEGVILGSGTAELIAALALGEAPPFDASPFDPLRF